MPGGLEYTVKVAGCLRNSPYSPARFSLERMDRMSEMTIYQVWYPTDTVTNFFHIWSPTLKGAKQIKKELCMGYGLNAEGEKLKPGDVEISAYTIDTSGGIKAAMCRAASLAQDQEGDNSTWENWMTQAMNHGRQEEEEEEESYSDS
mgnify:CR=1 FL=1